MDDLVSYFGEICQWSARMALLVLITVWLSALLRWAKENHLTDAEYTLFYCYSLALLGGELIRLWLQFAAYLVGSLQPVLI